MVKDSIRAGQDDPLCIYCVVGEIRVRPARAGQDRVTKELFRAGYALLHWLAGQSPGFYVGMEAVSGFLIGLSGRLVHPLAFLSPMNVGW